MLVSSAKSETPLMTTHSMSKSRAAQYSSKHEVRSSLLRLHLSFKNAISFISKLSFICMLLSFLVIAQSFPDIESDRGTCAIFFLLVYLKRFCNRLSNDITQSVVLKNPLKVCLPKPQLFVTNAPRIL